MNFYIPFCDVVGGSTGTVELEEIWQGHSWET